MAPVERLGIGLIVLGIVLGLATAVTGALDLTAPWLVIAYALVVTLFILGPIESVRYGRMVKAAERVAAAADDGATDSVMVSGETAAELHEATHDQTTLALTIRVGRCLSGHHLRHGCQALQLTRRLPASGRPRPPPSCGGMVQRASAIRITGAAENNLRAWVGAHPGRSATG